MRLDRCDDVEVVGMVDDEPHPSQRNRVIGRMEDIPFLCAAHRVDRVLVAFSRTTSHETLDVLRSIDGRVRISVIPRLYELTTWRSKVEELHGIPLVHVAPAQLSPMARAGKRFFDIIASALAIAILAPLGAMIAIAIKVSSPGPVFFRQRRAGRKNRPFSIFKFRTMYEDAEIRKSSLIDLNEIDGPIFKMRDDPRVTKVGRLLRSTSIDELPQLLNVFLGHMSLVGPRPFPMDEAAGIGGWATCRFDVLPGMTGLWQVSGRSALSYDDLEHLDSVYVSSWSFWWDMRILLETPRVVLKRSGAY
jgi:exopolysaccharide biosynthesis polyprenyl glycosylphosphotransferase